MNKYTELSDLKINRRIAVMVHKYSDFIEQYDNKTIYVDGNVFDPCNRPADAMQIIIENRIAMYFISDDVGWAAHDSNTDYGELEIYNKNYYRAAMICFLLIKNAENGG